MANLFFYWSTHMASVSKRLYLSLYNWVIFIGWFQVLFFSLKTTFFESGHDKHVFNAVAKPLLLAQSAAVFEITDLSQSEVLQLGLVKSPISATVPQIGSRLYVVWGILWSFPEIQTHVLVNSLVISWSITEIIRYSFFGLKEAFGYTPSWLLWLRYSTFVLLYPVGISSEVGLIYIAVPCIKASGRYSLRMPNKMNFAFDYLVLAIIAFVLYVPGSPYLYKYMMGQRKRAISKPKVA
ncbi:hypothetical protein ACFE04_021028 [Oxalis oulophora]